LPQSAGWFKKYLKILFKGFEIGFCFCGGLQIPTKTKFCPKKPILSPEIGLKIRILAQMPQKTPILELVDILYPK